MFKHRAVSATKLCLLMTFLSACGPRVPAGEADSNSFGSSGSVSNTRPLLITDDSQQEHEFTSVPERIVSLVPSATETLLALGLSNHLVGRTEYDEAPELRGRISVGGGLQPNLEVLISLDPDLVIRTGGEFRISNFLLWQSAYSEFYSTPVNWPDFDEQEMEQALEAFRLRKRRFGSLSAEG